jgi:hypothetical protein
MKLSAFRTKEAKFTASFWSFTVTRDSEGGILRDFSFNRELTFNCVTGSFGKVDAYLADTESDVIQLSQLTNLCGPDGGELVPHGIWQVELIAPAINIWGRREGFKARLAMIGTDTTS